MGQIIIKSAIKRRSKCLYYIDKEGNIVETKLNIGGKNTGKHKSYKNCQNCGEKLEYRRKYCSDDCLKIANSKRAKEKYIKKSRIDNIGICEVCGTSFSKVSFKHQICSVKCRKRKQEEIKNFEWFEKNKGRILSKSYNYLKLRFEIFKRDVY